jgi:hypothetical protein
LSAALNMTELSKFFANVRKETYGQCSSLLITHMVRDLELDVGLGENVVSESTRLMIISMSGISS